MISACQNSFSLKNWYQESNPSTSLENSSKMVCHTSKLSWESKAMNWSNWRKLLHDGADTQHLKCTNHAKAKCAARKGKSVDSVAMWALWQDFSFKSHNRTYENRPVMNYSRYQLADSLTCPTCNKICKNQPDLTRHMQHHNENSQVHISSKACKMLTGFRSHCRAHGCWE